MSPGPKRPLLIAVDGFSGAGKTSLALELAAELRAHRSVALFHLEDVYPGWDGLDTGMDYYRRRVLEPLAQGRSADWQSWDWAAGRYSTQHATEPADIVIFEGVGAGHRAARHLLDAVLWIESPEAVRRERALARDGETYAPHWNRWAAQEAAWAVVDPVPAAADILVRNEPAAVPSSPDDGGGSRAPAPLHQAAPGQVPLPRFVLRALSSLQLPSPGLGLPGPDLQVQVQTVDGAPDPLTLFAELFDGSPNAVWLDSSDAGSAGSGGSPAGRSRFSIMADGGGLHGRYAEHSAGLTSLTHGPVTTTIPGPFFRWLDREWGAAQVPAPGGLACPFALGWLGYLGYELKRETGGADVAGPGPDAALIFAGRALVLDHAAGKVHLLTLRDPIFEDGLSSTVPGPGRGDAERGAAQPAPDGDWSARAAAAVVSAARPADPAAGTGFLPAQGGGFRPVSAPSFSFRDSREDYLAKVRRSQQEIAEGNTYEVCLTTSLHAVLPEPLAPAALLDLYASLRRRSPAPFASLLRLGPLVLAGTSPERFLRIGTDGHLRAEPIKGTRPRGQDPAADASLRRELLESEKDRAENIMIVDLMRNDLSRLAVAGSVTVPRLCVVETYATVHQLVSTVDAQLLPDASRAEAVAAAFPAGSMTGAPKTSTMAILDELEAAPRGAYSGAVGYFSLTGAADLSVVIRTLVLRSGPDGGLNLSLGVGGAVTAGSDPDAEWEEVRTKARGVLGALGSEVPAG